MATEIGVLRLIVGVKKWEHRRNEEIRQGLLVELTEELVEKQVLRLCGHMQRMEDTRYPVRAYRRYPRSRRPEGRQRRQKDGTTGDVE